METIRKCCKDELPKGCPDCPKEDMFGDICHAYQAYQQGRVDERKKILGMVNWKQEEDVIRRKVDIHIDFDEMLTTENVLAIIVEQLKEQNHEWM